MWQVPDPHSVSQGSGSVDIHCATIILVEFTTEKVAVACDMMGSGMTDPALPFGGHSLGEPNEGIMLLGLCCHVLVEKAD